MVVELVEPYRPGHRGDAARLFDRPAATEADVVHVHLSGPAAQVEAAAARYDLRSVVRTASPLSDGYLSLFGVIN